MTSQDSTQAILTQTRSLSERMRSAYDVSRSTCTIGVVSVSLETLRSNLFSLIEHAKIRIHKASVNQTTPLTEKQAKLLNDAIYSMSGILRKLEQLATMHNRTNDRATVVCGEDFQEQMNTLMKKLNATSIEMSKLKRVNDNIMNIYSNYQLENEDGSDSDVDEDTDSSDGNNTVSLR
ncbi:uncharacterized protein LOC131427051 [Malaya genurostris]|uniref:uncharacterized protein LOC131427051 n=1 Tax=Malaya genurostris TaxID=325434 RepID=UPI0026F3B0A9|nr:uncharacterized protein LOC131427051 [Malaya genurostris]